MTLRLLAVAALVAAALPASADAAVLFGHDLSTGNLGYGLNSGEAAAINTPAPGSSYPVAAPSGGVVTRIRMRYGQTASAAGSVSFRVLRPEAGTGRFSGRLASPDGTLFRLPLLPNTADAILTYAPNDTNDRRVGIPVAAGDRIAVVAFDTGGAGLLTSNFPSSNWYFAGDPNDGAPKTFTSSNYSPVIEARLEPDADADGYGDETQDNCPSIANDQTKNPCPKEVVVQRETVAAPPLTVPGPRVVVPGALCTVPSLRGLSLAAATTRLTQAGCRRGAVRGKRSSRARVRSQTIPARTRVATGTTVGVSLRTPAVRRRRAG
jgi:hypothetical protein